MRFKKEIPEWIKEKLHTLTKKELKYFKMMWSNSGVVYLTAKPGVAKSAITRCIADKLGFAYIDRRLSMIDETDIGLYPDKIEIDGKRYLDFICPIWAYNANKQYTIVHFEEANRAQLQVRNAALQILNERAIGSEFKFNDNVLMVMSGNLGNDDACDVEEFDRALNGRLIHVRHTLEWDEWIDAFANVNVHPVIVNFIKNNPEFLYKDPTEEFAGAYASPRTWTFLSDYIVCHYGMESDPKEFADELLEIASCYIGPTGTVFAKYCQDMAALNIHDILNNFDEAVEQLNLCNRSKYNELIQSLKEIDILKMTDIHMENATKFLNKISEEELMDFMMHIVDKGKYDLTHPRIKKFLGNYRNMVIKMMNYTKEQSPKSLELLNNAA